MSDLKPDADLGGASLAPAVLWGAPGGYPLSPQQSRLWKLIEADPSGPWRSVGAVRFRGEVDLSDLGRRVRRLAARHEVLRTRFRLLPGLKVPVQEVGEELRVEAVLVDLAGVPAGNGEIEASALAARVLEVPLDLECEPSLRLILARLEHGGALLVFSLPAPLADRRSLEILAGELAGGELSDPEEEALQYADAAQLFHDLLEGEATEPAAAAGERLPFEKDAQQDGPVRPASSPLGLPPETTEALSAAAAAAGVPVRAFALAAWAALLGRLGGRPTALLGVACQGRTFEGMERALGAYARTVPVTLSCGVERTLAELAFEVAGTLVAAEGSQERVAPGAAAGRASFEWLDPVGDGEVSILQTFHERVRLELALGILGRRATGELRYDRGRFAPHDIHRLARCFETLVADAAERPGAVLRDLRLMPEVERHRVLVELPLGEGRSAGFVPVHRRIERWAAEHPDRPALMNPEGTLSYGELSERADRLAEVLVSRGVGPERVAAVLLDRSDRAVTAVLAILKAGGAFLPLDPATPAERLAVILRQATPAILVTDHRALPGAAPAEVPVFFLDDWTPPAEPAGTRPAEQVEPAALAYVLYTSGSTGAPKGILVSHGALSNLIAGLEDLFGGEGLRVAWTAGPAFDASVQQIFGALVGGHLLHPVPEAIKRDGRAFSSFLRERRIEVTDATPALLSILASAGGVEPVPSLRRLLVGGEVLSRPLAERARERLGTPGPEVFNLYGVAECCVDTTVGRLGDAEVAPDDPVPVGRPLRDLSVYVLDARLGPVPQGIVGEVWIGGTGLGRGYLGSPALTAERFLPDPAGNGARLYRTGDLGRWRPDGGLDLLGRIDDQVQVRGFRVELREIEATLARHPAVLGCAVVALRSEPALGRPERRCPRCFVSSRMPNVGFDDQGVCDACRAFERHRAAAEAYFRREDDLRELIAQVRRERTSSYDCVFLFSGGKDSAYALHRLVEMGARVLSFTFDNGFLSTEALHNVRRLCEELGVEHVTVTAANMAEVFRESLRLDSSVCTGCFRAITFLSTRLAIDRGIPMVVTALSRGQIYETKLAGFLRRGELDPGRVDSDLHVYRKLYHSQGDRIGRLLGDDLMEDEQSFDRLRFVDFFRYSDVTEAQILDYLAGRRSGWRLPSDVGFGTSNCLINDLGIHAHLRGKGYHYYADQFSWEVRLGHIAYEEARRSLEAKVDPLRVEDLSRKIGYAGPQVPAPAETRLAAYVVADGTLSQEELRRFLATSLPDYMIPAAFVFLDRLPMTAQGKVDRAALPEPEGERPRLAVSYVPPRSAEEARMAEIWTTVLGIRKVGAMDGFFELGGHSLSATDLVARVERAFGVALPLRSLIRYPTLEALTEQVVELRRQDREVPSPGLPQVVPQPGERLDPFPLNDVQQAYWIGRTDALDMGGVSSHEYTEIEAVDLDLARFDAAWRRLVERHDMLRAVLLPDGTQKVLATVPDLSFPVEDLCGQEAAQVEERLAAVRAEMSHQVLPADRAPLFELRVSRIGERRCRIHLSLDSLIVDAWSVTLLAQELSFLYRSPDAVLPPLSLTFRDYVLAERGLEGSEIYRRAWEHWQRRLRDLPPPPRLPVSTTGRGTPRFTRRERRVRADAWAHLKELSARSGITPTALLLAAFAEVLRTWSGQGRFTLNLTVFNRLPLHPEVDRIVGDFTSVTLLGVDLSERASFAEGAKALQERLWSDLEHRAVSGVRLIGELARLWGAHPGALLPVVFTSELGFAREDGGASPWGWLGEEVFAITQTPQVYLDHQVAERAGALVIRWDAVEELFPPGLLDGMFEAFNALLDCLSTMSAWRSRPSLVPAGQRARRTAVNDTQAAVPGERLDELVTLQAARFPDRVAVVAPDLTLSYGELQERAGRLAAMLVSASCGSGCQVAVVAEKGWEQAVAVLAILQAGAAYLPVDPELPAERFRHLLRHGEVAAAISPARLFRALPWPDGLAVFPVDAPAVAPAPVVPATGPDDLAYILYTSGSTGLPKGVMISHRAAVNTVLDINRRFGLGPGDRVLSLSALSFDLSVWDLFGLWAVGGAVVLPEPWAARRPDRWLELLDRHGVTVWNSVPALLELLLEHLDTTGGTLPASLRLVLLSGDWIPVGLAGRLRALAPGAEVVSLGGATEAAIWSMMHPIGEPDPGWPSVPYGRPLTNQQIEVVDAFLEPLPDWVPGEIVLGGEGLAYGYWRDPERTASSFVPEAGTGRRLYRTGDLGRWRPGGLVEFLGRIDRRVKVRGFRIEPGEIEAALRGHSAVADAVVVVQGLGTDARLVAFIVPRPEETRGFDPQSLEGETLDPRATLALRLSRPGERTFADDEPSLALPRSPDEKRRQRFLERRSIRTFGTRPVRTAELGRLLDGLSTIDLEGVPKLRYPSAGGLYPVQLYVWVRAGRVEGLAEGAYYYHPHEHRLVGLSSPGAAPLHLDRAMHAPVNRAAFDASAFTLLLIGRMAAIEPVYGRLAREFCVFEAGCMTQVLMADAAACGLGLCPIGSLDAEPLRDGLALEEGDVFLHALLGGPAEAGEREDAGGKEALLAELRGFLAGVLPRASVPSRLVLLDSLPLTANGKVDRGALAEAARQDDQERPFVAPASESERRLAAHWRELLDVERVGAEDGFFDLGGTSVALLRLARRLAEEWGRTIAPLDLFRYPTLRSLAAFLDGGEAPPDGEGGSSPRRSLEKSRDRGRRRRAPASGEHGR